MEMKTRMIGISLAVLMVATGIGFGIAQAGWYDSDKPGSELQHQDKNISTSSDGAGPVDTGKVPVMTDEEFAKFAEAEREKYRGMPDIDGH